MMVILLTFCLPLVASAEVKQLVCIEEKPLKDWDKVLSTGQKKEQEIVAAQIRECGALNYYKSYSVTFEETLLEVNQYINVELEYDHCVSDLKRPKDNGVKRMTVSANELSIFHYGTTYFYVDRSSLEWGVKSRFSNFKFGICEIKDLNTSQRKI